MIQRAKVLAKNTLPPWAYKSLKWAHDWVLRRGAYDFRVKKHRSSPTDYVLEFEQRSFRRAKANVLWNEDWEEATQNHLEVLRRLDLIRDGQLLVDFGVGVGRVARALLENYDVRVIGVDRSQQMLGHASGYIPSRFFEEGKVKLWSDREFLENILTIEGKVDLILFILVLEHIPEPVLDDLFPHLLQCLAPKGLVFVFGNEVLDVDCQGNLSTTPTETFLRKHIHIVRKEVWDSLEGRSGEFGRPRYVFLCQAPREARNV